MNTRKEDLEAWVWSAPDAISMNSFVIPAAAVEAVQPERSTCPDCGGDGQAHNPCTCPGWVSVDDIPHADLKALLANDDLSLGVFP